jgi:5-methylcytosine-specific restriction protein A
MKTRSGKSTRRGMESQGSVGEEKFRIEKAKARKLRKSQWWLQKVQEGVCHYCGGKFAPEEITMDHIVPISRGGKSGKGNIVAACKTCNSKKKYYTPAEIILRDDMEKDVNF